MATQTLTLSGTFQVGQTITANTTTSRAGYRWLFYNDSIGTPPASFFYDTSTNTFVIPTERVGLYMRANAYNMYPIVGSPPTPTEIMTINTASPQIAAAAAASPSVAISGTLKSGQVLTANVSNPDSTVYAKYNWHFFDNAAGTGTPLLVPVVSSGSGISASNTFLLTEAHVGKYVKVRLFDNLGYDMTNSIVSSVSSTPIAAADPVSNVCFLAGTKVVTDQGIINIEKVSNKNSINGQNVNFVSITENVDDYMVVLKKDALYKNVPNADTYVTGNHKIFFNRQMIKAKNLVNNTSISKVEMERAVVYNVLLEGEEDGKMIANGMIAETLSPKSPMTEVLMLLNNANLQEKAMMISNFNANMLREHNSRKVTSKKM